MKPAPYFVEYWKTEWVEEARAKVGDDFDPSDVTDSKGFATLASARKFFAQCQARLEGPRIYLRTNLRDVTPDEDPPGLLWEWDTELVED
jgi:hypothetical protein